MLESVKNFKPFGVGDSLGERMAKFPHSPILHYACRSLLTEIMAKQCNSCGIMRCFCCFKVVKQRTTHIEPHA